MEEAEEGGRRRAMFCGRTGLLVLMTGYAFFGALLFKTLEGSGDEGGVPTQVQRSREDCLRELWLITERLNVLYEKNWTRLVTEQLKRFERAVVESGKSDGNANPTAPPHWTFGGALLYSLTLLTTVGYGRLSPRTALGKVVAVVYALIGVPLMLILLSALGTVLASAARRIYARICCRHQNSKNHPTVGYHKAPSSPPGKNRIQHDDSASMQISSPNHVCKSNHQQPTTEVVQKRAVLATVRASHVRGRCRQDQVRQLLAESTICPAHSPHLASSTHLAVSSSDIEDTDDPDEHELILHDTPSRVPLIWRRGSSHEQPNEEITINNSETVAVVNNYVSLSRPTVPASLVVIIFVGYVCVGAVVFVSAGGWGFLDAIYFCFIALSTIGIGDKLPQSGDTQAQFELLACCLYLFVGLVVVAMCFSLVHEEISNKCRHIANNIGLPSRH